mgnify:FL=1|jgi:hypothetical protein
MDKNQIKRGAVVAASAATLFGLVFATPSFAATSSTSTSTSSTSTVKAEAAHKGQGKEIKGKGHGNKGKGQEAKGSKGDKVAPVAQNVDVYVPADGKTYKVVVTEVLPSVAPSTVAGAVVKPAKPAHTIVVAVTGVGPQTVSVPGLRPGNYTVELVAVSSSQSLTVAAPVVTPDPAASVAPTN